MSLSTPVRQALQRVSDPHGLLWLLTVTGGGIVEPVRVVSDTRDHIILGQTYIGLPFEVVPPKESAKEVPRAQIRLDNIGREFVAELEQLEPGAELMATLQCVYRATPDVIEQSFAAPLSSIRADVFSISASMGPSELLRRPAVNIRFDPITAPGLFPD